MSDEWMRTLATRWIQTLQGAPPPIQQPGAGDAGDLPTLRFGDQSSDVRALQEFMKRRYPTYTPFEPTSFYGPATTKTMAEYQKRKGITVPSADGTIVGPRTNEALWADGYRGV